MITKIKQLSLYLGYAIIVILLSKLLCVVDNSIKQPITIIDIDSSSVITETEEPE